MQELLRRISTWLQPQGLLFIHIFCHKRFAYHFEVSLLLSASTWSPATVLGGALSARSLMHCSQSQNHTDSAFVLQ